MSGRDVVLRAVAKRYESVHALGPVDLRVEPGEFFTVIGPSGCGKSSLLDIVAGLVQPSGGEVAIGGVPVARRVPDGIGVVFQEDASFPWLSVRDNIAFGLRHRRVEPGERARRVDHALAFFGLAEFAAAHPHQLSGGMRQRMCIARTLVLRPSLILLDEPFGALDQQTRLVMGDELLRLWRETGATVILVTHSLDEAAALSDRVGVMSGRPGRFLEVIRTGWPPGRDSGVVAEPGFGALTARLWSLLRDPSRRAAAAPA